MSIFISCLSVSVAEETSTDEWYEDWSYRKLITINSALIDEDLMSFPILVYILSDSDLSAHAKDTGDDIIFTDMSGIKLNHEIEKYDHTTVIKEINKRRYEAVRKELDALLKKLDEEKEEDVSETKIKKTNDEILEEIDLGPFYKHKKNHEKMLLSEPNKKTSVKKI